MKFKEILKRFARFCCATLCVVLLQGCASRAVPSSPVSAPAQAQAQESSWAADFGDLRQAAASASNEQALWPIAADSSTLNIHVFRAGRAARLGHNHVLNAPKLTGWLRLPIGELDLGALGFELSLRLDELLLDDPAARAALGSGWASALAPEMIAATRANMLGAAGLQADRYPLLRVRSLRVAGALPKLAVLIELELHGQRRQQWLALQAGITADRAHAKGAMVVRQSDFGLTPFSVAGGLLAVQDELLIEFDLWASPPAAGR